MSTFVTPLQVRDAYDMITCKLQYPSSVTLRKIFELAMSLGEAQLMQRQVPPSGISPRPWHLNWGGITSMSTVWPLTLWTH